MARSRRGGHHEGAHENNERWLVSYADMITLLVVFFIILYAQANIDQSKFSKLAISFRQAFGAGVQLGSEQTGMIVGEGGRAGEIEIANFKHVAQEMEKFVEQQGLTDEISIGSRKEGLVIEMSGNVLFPSGSADLKPGAAIVLDKVAELVAPIPNQLRVEGHTDNVPVDSQEFPTNWELSSARAVTVARYFVEQRSVNAERVGAAGFGEFRPLVPNDTREHRAKNRRVELVVLKAEFASEMTTDLQPLGVDPIQPAGALEKQFNKQGSSSATSSDSAPPAKP
jgi:chemotaxis protein MotB